MKLLKVLWLSLVVPVVFNGCSTVKNNPGPSAAYLKAYESTNPKIIGGVKPGSEEEKQAVKRVTNFFAVLTEESVRQQLRSVYADNAYFCDTLKEIQGIEELESYLLRSASAVDSCTIEMLDVAANQGEYYFRWAMYIKFKRFKKGEVQPSIGITHIRFDREGKVAFHQDYWDASSNFFEKIPLLGWGIRKIKKRL